MTEDAWNTVKGLAGIGSVAAGVTLVDMYVSGGVNAVIGLAGAGAVLSGADSLYWGVGKITGYIK